MLHAFPKGGSGMSIACPGIEHLVTVLRDTDRALLRHSEQAVLYALLIGEALGLKSGQMAALRKGGLVHDLGKLAIPRSILDKPDPLSAEEWAIMHCHPVEGYARLVGKIENAALDVVLYHHEWYDGQGYPGRAKGQDIPILARVFSVADAFEAMTSDRPNRKAISPILARQELLLYAGTQFDAVVVEAFCDIFEDVLHVCQRNGFQAHLSPVQTGLTTPMQLVPPVSRYA